MNILGNIIIHANIIKMPLFNKHKSYFWRYPNISIDDLSIEPKGTVNAILNTIIY